MVRIGDRRQYPSYARIGLHRLQFGDSRRANPRVAVVQQRLQHGIANTHILRPRTVAGLRAPSGGQPRSCHSAAPPSGRHECPRPGMHARPGIQPPANLPSRRERPAKTHSPKPASAIGGSPDPPASPECVAGRSGYTSHRRFRCWAGGRCSKCWPPQPRAPALVRCDLFGFGLGRRSSRPHGCTGLRIFVAAQRSRAGSHNQQQQSRNRSCLQV